MASKSSPSAVRSAPRAERPRLTRVERYGARLARELGDSPEGTVEHLEAALTDPKLVRVGEVVGDFIGQVEGALRDREYREVLPDAPFPPIA